MMSLIIVDCGMCASGSAVEHLLAKEGVAGSIPVSRLFLGKSCEGLLFYVYGYPAEYVSKADRCPVRWAGEEGLSCLIAREYVWKILWMDEYLCPRLHMV